MNTEKIEIQRKRFEEKHPGRDFRMLSGQYINVTVGKLFNSWLAAIESVEIDLINIACTDEQGTEVVLLCDLVDAIQSQGYKVKV